MNPKLVMLAGPNGAGKSTFYQAYLADLDLPFLNADVFAARFSLDAYEAASRIAILRDALIEARASFITETVFSDPVGEKVRILEQATREGYEVDLIYIGLRDAALSRLRVQGRVRAGGHDVPVEKLAARYSRSLVNLGRAIEQLPRVRVHDNSSETTPHRFLAEFRNGTLVQSGKRPFPAWFQPFVE